VGVLWPIEFPKGTLETADAAAVKKVVDEVLATQATVDTGLGCLL